MSLHAHLIRLSILLLAGSIGVSGADREAADFFERHVRPVFAEHCYACHSGSTPMPQADLRVDSRAALLKGGKSGPAIMPGDPLQSRLTQVLQATEGVRMPPTGALSEVQIGYIEEWIRMGAPFPVPGADGLYGAEPAAPAHWSFVAPQKAEPPQSSTGWAQTAVDRFVEARLAASGLKPSPRAAPRTLIRRISYDLTGLPLSPEDADAFADAPSPANYEALVDSLLESDRFGERWARYWLDVVRYSDDGAQSRPFPIAWTYRDWVVDAFNEDMPYDKFVERQLAADLMEGDRRHLAALGLLTVGINLVRPTDVPENIDDRIDVVTRGFLGLSVSCARCHDHKFDRITQDDYYSLYGVFLNSPDALEPVPLEDLPEGPNTEFFRQKLAMRRAWLNRFPQERLPDHVREFRKPEILARYLEAAWNSRAMSNQDVEALSKEKDLNRYVLDRWRTYLSGLVGPSVHAFMELNEPGGALRVAQRMVEADSVYRWPDPQREALRLALRGNGSPTDIPVEDFWWVQNEGDSNVMKALKWQYEAVMYDWSLRGGPRHAAVVREAKKMQPSYIFVRGNQHDKGAEVERGFLSALPGPEEFQSGSGRLELARAIATPENPLTARVMVNRIWGHLFGEGLVRTPSDFGVRGDPPSHPELLDYLATEFIAGDWSVKELIRRIALSKAYQQASSANGSGAAEDPDNLLLWRQRRIRLDFEALRDSMLAVSERLETSVGGPPFDVQATPSSPRRTVYAYVSRERPSALMRTFDFSNPEEHSPRRQITTVPQQALFLMNSSFLAQQARSVATKCADAANCVARIHRQVLGRPAEPSELEAGIEFVEQTAREAPDSSVPSATEHSWSYGTARLDPAAGATSGFKEMAYRIDERLQPTPMLAAGESGRASMTATGGHPGDGLDEAVVRRWSAPRAMSVAITGTLSHTMGQQAKRFEWSNGVRGWLVSSRQGILASWTVQGIEAETALKNLEVEAGERLDFVVDSRDDYESDQFWWAPRLEEVLAATQREAGMVPRVWNSEDEFPQPLEQPLNAFEQYAQTLLMTNEFAFRD